MTFLNRQPPQETQEDEYPTFDKAVTVSNCFYYLSLLERFVETTKTMPEDILKLYLVRAEYRYFKWAYASNASFGSTKNAVPPLDIAFFWQAHMLSPLRFYEDSLRNPQLSKYKDLKIPLKEIHETATNIPSDVLTAWKQVMEHEPYYLTQESLLSCDNVHTRYAEISCIVCFVRMKIEWKNYAEWRTDHTVALQCHRCSSMFTIKHIGKANLIFDCSRSWAVAGLMLKDNQETTKDRVSIGSVRDIKSLPFNEGLKPLEGLIALHQVVKWKDDEYNLPRRKSIIDAIQSTYLCNPYRGSSLDLIQAVARQYKFAFKVTQVINWDLPQGIIKGIRQYSNFLCLIKTNPNLTAVPTYEIDLAWHTHMLFPDSYRKFTVGYTGKFLNHDDTIPESQLQQYVENTDQAWKFSIERKNEATSDVDNASLPKASKNLKKKFKGIFATKRDTMVDSEKLFQDSYNPGSFQVSPPYESINDNKNNNKEETNKYNAINASFHDRRDIKEFINLKNSETVMTKKFDRVKRSELGFIGTSTCGTTDYLNKWESANTKANEKREDSKSSIKDETYSQVFVSKGDMPEMIIEKIMELPFDQKTQQLRYEMRSSFERSRNATISESFDWRKVSFIWANSFKDKEYAANTLSNPGAGIGASCGGTGIASCENKTASSGNGKGSCVGVPMWEDAILFEMFL